MDQFSSVYQCLTHEKTEVWFALQSLMRFVKLEDVEDVSSPWVFTIHRKTYRTSDTTSARGCVGVIQMARHTNC